MSDSANTVETHSVDANDDLVRSVIVDQTDNLEKGWREAFQNSIDSDASEARLDYDTNYTLIADDGSGVNLTEQAGIDLLTTMGESSKDASNHETIGEFGIGKGQIIAKGRTVFISGDTGLLFDIKNWGLEARTVPLPNLLSYLRGIDPEWADLYGEVVGAHINHYDGLGILVQHYEDEVPGANSYKWDRYEDDLRDRFRYLESVRDTELRIEGTQISNNDPIKLDGLNDAHAETYESDEAGRVLIAVEESNTGSLSVYSGGIYVTDVDSRGLSGRVVTERNLRLNFARNEIKSGCPVWNEVQDRLDEIRAEMFGNSSGERLNEDARAFIADRIFNHGEADEYGDMGVFETASEDLVSLDDVKSRSEVGEAPQGHRAADRLEEAYGMIVLSTDDDASKTLLEVRADSEQHFGLPDGFDAEAKAEEHGLHQSYDKVKESDLTPTQYKQLGVARYMADKIGISRRIEWGESDVAHAWTDSLTHITITDSAVPSSRWIEWVPQLWQTLIHEYAHKHGGSKNDPSHGLNFTKRYRNAVEKEDEGIEALSETMGEIQDTTLKTVAERGHRTQV